MRGGELCLQVSGAASSVDFKRIVAIGTVDLHFYTAQRQRFGPGQANMVLVADDGEDAFRQQATAEDMRFPGFGERGNGDQHGRSRGGCSRAYQLGL
jgi:hypothetical protein